MYRNTNPRKSPNNARQIRRDRKKLQPIKNALLEKVARLPKDKDRARLVREHVNQMAVYRGAVDNLLRDMSHPKKMFLYVMRLLQVIYADKTQDMFIVYDDEGYPIRIEFRAAAEGATPQVYTILPEGGVL